MPTLLLLLLTLLQPPAIPSNLTLVVQDKSGLPPSQIFLASSATGWNPAAAKLSARSDSRWQIVIPQPEGGAKLEFKFTRGSWDTVETAADGADIPNRTIDLAAIKPGDPPILELTIPKWADQRPGAAPKTLDPYHTIQATGTVKRLQVVGGGPPGIPPRDLLVWLPPGYEASPQRTYPVLYLMDGQNIFERIPGIPAEWGADETATRLIESHQIEPLIIVGIPHAGPLRMQEYIPLASFQNNPAYGEAFVAWLMTEVTPRVERSFRVRPGPDSTAIGGSSLGGLISLYAASRHPDIFGKVLAESPALILGDDITKDLFSSIARWPSHIYLGMGDHETADPATSARLVDAVKNLDTTIKSAGIPDAQRLLIIEPNATHTESAWANRLPAALKFLFPP